MWLFTLIFFFLEYSLTQNTPLYLRKTTLSSKYMQTLSFSYNRVVNAAYYSYWTTPMNTYYSDTKKNNLQFQYTTTINSISSGANTYGFQIAVRLASIWDTGIILAIADAASNKLNDPMVWYSVRIFIFLLPRDVPYIMVAMNRMIYSTIGQNLYILTNQTFTQQLILNPTFAQYCYYDSAKTIRDKIHVMPSLLQLSVVSPEYVNLTSKSNWVYDWNSSTTTLYFDLTISAYNSQASYFVMNVLGLCPNSYKYAQYNLSMAVSRTNWFNLQPSNSLYNKYRSVFLQYPFSNDNAVMMGMSITGLSIYSRNFNSITTSVGTSLMFVSFNITQGYDSNGAQTGYLGNLSYSVINPQNCYGLYWMFGVLGGCPNNLVQHNHTHCICPKGTIFSYTSGRCLNCTLIYDDICGSCNQTKCLGCSNGLYFYQSGNKPLCINCSQQFGQQCGQCSDSACLKCNNNYTINASKQCECHLFDNFIDIITGVCLECPLKFPFCINCTYNGCFGCIDRFILGNGTCLCFFPNILALGSCFGCVDLFGVGCTQCNSTCLSCDTNFQLINNTCQCLGQGLTLSDSQCLRCSELFGVGCLLCNVSTCLSCSYYYQLNSTNCTCPALTYAITNGTCQSCSDLFSYCMECSNLTCSRCLNNFQYYDNNCTCEGDRFLTLAGGCQLCTNVHVNCQTCNRGTCLSCAQNFTLVDGRCMCLPPLISIQSRCMRCQDLKDSLSGCSVSAELQHYQSGISLYFWFRYSAMAQQIKFNSPLQFNIVVRANANPVSFSYHPQTGIFVVDLSRYNHVSSVTVQLLNQQHITPDGRQFNYQPVTFIVSQVSTTATFNQFLRCISIIRNYAIFISLLLCLGVLNKLFRSLTIVVVMCLSLQNLPNSIGLISDALNINPPLNALNLQLGWNLQRIECDQLHFVAYGLNKSIVEQSFELYLAGMMSALLIAYIRNYLNGKQKFELYLGWRNILAHSGQYLLYNILNLHALLCFPALLQLKLIISIGTAAITKNIVNFVLAIYLLSLPGLLITIYLVKYRHKEQLGVVCWLLTTLQPYIMCIASLFMPSHVNLYVMVAVNGLAFIVCLMCVRVAVSKAEHVCSLVKQACVLFVSISLLFNRQDWLLLKVASYFILAICLGQLLQLLFKTLMPILIIKGIISRDVAICNQQRLQPKSDLAQQNPKTQ